MKIIFKKHLLLLSFSWLVIPGLYGAEAEPPLTDAERAFFENAKLGALDKIREYLAQGGDIHRLSGGLSALHIAAWKGEEGVAAYLLEHGIDLNRQDTVTKRAALHYAIEADRLPLIRILLNAPGIDVNVKDYRGITPLLAAARAGKFDIALKLIQMGADVKAVNNNAQNILHIAIQYGQFDFLRSFLELRDDLISPAVKQKLKDGRDWKGLFPVFYLDLRDPQELNLQNLLKVSPSALSGLLESLGSQVQELSQVGTGAR